jgi:hypothetical protein
MVSSDFASDKNIILIAAYLFIGVFLLLVMDTFPSILVVLSALMGVIAGTIKILTFNEGKDVFLQTVTTVEVHRVMLLIRWGRVYIYFLCFAGLLIGAVAITLGNNLFLNLLLSYTVAAFFRELTTVKTILAIQQFKK